MLPNSRLVLADATFATFLLNATAASFLLAAGTHTKVVQEQLGHSSYAITAGIYSHVAPAQAREAVDRMDEALQW